MSEKDTEMTTVRVQFDIPAFIGSDMRKYGPFKAGDVAVISKANADFLMSKGVVSTRVEETPKAKEEENRWALPDHSYKQRPCDRTAKPVEDNPGDLKRQLEELTAQVGKIATRIDDFERLGPSGGNRKRCKDKNRCNAYLDKECIQIVEPWRTSPDEKTKDVLKRCLLWLRENLKANQNHQNPLQNSLDS